MVREKMNKLPEFPQKPKPVAPQDPYGNYWEYDGYTGSCDACHMLWKNAVIAYWEQRCRLAVAVLYDVRDNACTVDDASGYAANALTDIGELPQAQP
jgi:hypothetical protein